MSFFKKLVSCILYVAFLVFFICPASAEIIFHDAVCLKGETVLLRAETKGKLFSKGGEIVEFIIDKKSIGKSLSGGDGFAFKEFTPRKARLYQISVSSGKDKGKGTLLSLNKGAGIVFIDVEGSILYPLSNEPVKDSQAVIKVISKKLPIVYVQTGIFGMKNIKNWLQGKDFAAAPILPWQDGAIFEEINKKGLRIRYIIGSPAVIESAKRFKPKAFSFEEAEGAKTVKGWKDIGKILRLVPGR